MPISTLARRVPPAVSVVTLCIGGLASALTQTLVIPIQSELPDLLGTSHSNAAWVVTVTLLAAAVTMVVSGRLADLFGKKPVLLVSAVTLTAASLICASPTRWSRCWSAARCRASRWASSRSASR